MALVLGVAGCAPAPPAPTAPPPPPFARPAGATPYGLTQGDRYRDLLNAEYARRRALNPRMPADPTIQDYWVPATTTRIDLAAWYAKAAGGWTPDPAPPFGLDVDAAAAAAGVFALAYRNGAHHMRVVGVEWRPDLKPAGGLLPLSIETDIPPPPAAAP